jgi:hypothetical protein
MFTRRSANRPPRARIIGTVGLVAVKPEAFVDVSAVQVDET